MYLDVSAAPYNANKTGTADARAAFASADAAGGTLYVPRGTYRIDSNLTLSSDIHFEQGAVLRPAANVTVTLNGGLDAGVFQVFDIKTNSGAKVLPRRAAQLIPQWWGATGDGTTDDYLPIAAALSTSRKSGEYGTATEGAVIFFPPGIYRITTPLDCNGGQFNLRGSGSHNTVIRGDTGAGHAIIELLGAGFCTLEGLLLDTPDAVGGSSSNSSTVGVLLGRLKDGSLYGGGGAHLNLMNLSIRLHSDPTAHGGQGTVAIYNYGAENADYYGILALADTAAVYTSSNLYSLDSVHRPSANATGMFTSGTSMTACSVTGNNSLWGIFGPALRLNGCANIHVHSDLFKQGTYPYAIEVLAQTTDFEFRGSMEGYYVLLRNRSVMTGLKLLGYAAYAGTTTMLPQITGVSNEQTHAAIILMDPPSGASCYIANSIINVTPTSGSTSGYLVDQAVDGSGNPIGDSSIQGSQIFLHVGDIRLMQLSGHPAGSIFNGNQMITARTRASVSLVTPNASSNVFIAGDGVVVDGITVAGKNANGVRLDTGKVGVGNSAAGATLGTVVKKVEIFDASGTSLGFVPVYNTIT